MTALRSGRLTLSVRQRPQTAQAVACESQLAQDGQQSAAEPMVRLGTALCNYYINLTTVYNRNNKYLGGTI